MNTSRIWTLLAVAGAIAGLTAGGSAAISPALASARRTMDEARRGPAARLEPDELLVAQRTLDVAEGQSDGSQNERHYAYMAERQTRIAMTNARTTLVEQGLEEDRDDYQAELERITRERGRALENADRALAAQQGAIIQQQQQLAQSEQQIAESQARLAAEQQARAEAEQRAADALTRLRELASVRTESTQTIITLTGDVLFETDRAELRPEARSRLLAVADAVRATGVTATIVGYTDSRGSDEYNRQLSQRRAESVRTFLVGEGVPADRIRAEGQGEMNPIANNATAEGRAENRRVEIALTPVTQVAQTSSTTTVSVAAR
ncbi:MAG: DUF4398 and OmpA-like domain-containing protein [Deltaproteobacteria bacterium]|nr:DUF4398 and OmpA-like domain-containing protein [Deltaproteobacteria bacterium]